MWLALILSETEAQINKLLRLA